MELSKTERIAAELQKIKTRFDALTQSEKEELEGLFQNSAFMKVTLEYLQAEINAEGAVDEYQNGANQHGRKISATIQSYNALMKNYLSVQKQLLSMLPKEASVGKFEAFMKADD